MSVNPISPDVFQGGQITDLPVFTGTLDGTELLEIVAAGAGQNIEADGINYSLTSALLSALIIGFGLAPTIITAPGSTPGSPYPALATQTRILFNKLIGAASGVDIGGGAARANLPIMVRDIKGDADVNNISVFFTGTCDGLASPIVISQPYAGYTFNPLPNGNWYLSNA